MGKPKAPGKAGTRKREELEREEAQEQLAAAAGANPHSGDQQKPQEQQEAQTFMQHDFGLDRRLIKAVAKMGFVYPTLVQNKCIPLALKGKDLLVRIAASGPLVCALREIQCSNKDTSLNAFRSGGGSESV